MRVHPNTIGSSNTRWHFPVAVVLLLGVLITNVMRGSDNTADAALQMSMKPVVVVVTALERGKEITKEMLKRELRPASTLPADIVTEWSEIEGRVPVGLVPAGYPLAKALLVFPSEQVEQSSTVQVPEVVDPFIEKLKKLEPSTVAISIPFNGPAPQRGARVALSLKGDQNRSALIADEVWVEKAMGVTARVRVKPTTALYLEEAKSLGTFSYFVLSEEGESPFKDQIVSNINTLKERFGLVEKDKPKQKVVAKQKKASKRRIRPDSFSSYAWVTGEGVKYSVGRGGKLFVITEDGSVAPLYSSYFPKQENSNSIVSWFNGDDEEEDAEEEVNHVPSARGKIGFSSGQVPNPNTRVETGLEMFYPLAGVKR